MLLGVLRLARILGFRRFDQKLSSAVDFSVQFFAYVVAPHGKDSRQLMSRITRNASTTMVDDI